MQHPIHEVVQNTRVILRRQQLTTILQQFDGEIMQLTKEQRVEKYTKMAESPFRFYRGSAFMFYYDVTKVQSPFHTPESKPTWIMGDMHMDNFGAFQNEKGQIVYDVNDFDEGYIGSYLYDIFRMGISIALYIQECGGNNELQQTVIENFLKSYIKQMKRFQQQLDDPMTFICTRKNTTGPIKRVLKKLKKRQITNAIKGITMMDEGGHTKFLWSDEIKPAPEEMHKKIEAALSDYHIVDIAVKHGSGTASIGLNRYYILIDNHCDATGRDHLVLEMKEVRTAIPAYFLPYADDFWRHYEHQGARVVGTQKAMHHLQDPHLAYTTIDGIEYYIRERSPYKSKVKPKHYRSDEEYCETAAIMGQIAAKIHARADLDISDVFTYHSEDEILNKIAVSESLFVEQMTIQAMQYKEMVNSDYQLFIDWLLEFKA